MFKLLKGFIMFLGICFFVGGILCVLQILGIGNFPIVKREDLGLSILVTVAALVVGACLIYFPSGFRATRKNNKRFDETINRIKGDGYKITYANRNTGTISYKDENNEIRQISVYKGFNSHAKEY